MARKRRRLDPSVSQKVRTEDGWSGNTVRKAEHNWDLFLRWLQHVDIEIDLAQPVPDWLVALYIVARLKGDWGPRRGDVTPARPVKLKTARLAAEGIAFWLRQSEIGMTGNGETVSAVLSAGKRLAPVDQVMPKMARTIRNTSEDEMSMILDHLSRVGEESGISELWALSWKARILTMFHCALRVGEAMTATLSDLTVHKDPRGLPVYLLTLPKTKSSDEEVSLAIFCGCDSSGSDRCPYHVLAAWVDTLETHGYQGRLLFPETPRYDPRLPLEVTGPIRRRSANDAAKQRVLDDIVSPVIALSEFDQSWDLEFAFQCRVCAEIETTTLRVRSGRKYGCRACSKRSIGSRNDKLNPSGDRFVEGLPTYIEKSTSTSKPMHERHRAAMQLVTNRFNRQYAELCRGAGIQPRSAETLSSHGLRRGAITSHVERGGSLQEVQQFARHQRVDTTVGYIDRSGNYTHATKHLEPWDRVADGRATTDLDSVIRRIA